MEVYLVVPNGAEWEDIILFLSKEEAIAKSKKWPNTPVQIFSQKNEGFHPAYKYYLNGELKVF